MSTENQSDSAVLNALTCPITLELFVDPVLASDGYTYERSAIVEWIKYHNDTSPLTRQSIKIKDLKSNRLVKQLADQYRTTSSSTNLTSTLPKALTSFTGDGTLLSNNQKIAINKLFSTEKRWLLIYKGSQDGFASGDFHRLCNNRGPTLTLIQSRNRFLMKNRKFIFGGYTTVPWSSQYGFHRDPQAFLFQLTQDKLTRFNIHSKDDIAVSHYLTAGPVFGLDDIHICHRANENNLNSIRFPYCFDDLTENGKGQRTFSNTKYFLVNEIEVYTVIE